MIVTVVSHSIALIAFGALAAVLALGGNRQGAALYLIAAAIATAGWSAAVTITAFSGSPPSLIELAFETIRSGAWIAFLYRLLLESGRRRGLPPFRYVLGPGLLFFGSIILADALIDGGYDGNSLVTGYAMVGRLIIPVVALTLIENLARDDWQKAQWWARFLFVGLGTFFAYDLFLYSETLLFHRVNFDLYAVRGAVDTIAVPLMAVSFARNPTFAIDIHVSRRFVFHTMTLGLTGGYFILMAFAGYYLRDFGGTWGALLQIIFFCAAIILVFLTISSGTFRSAIRNFVSSNFFSYKYDYRHEWLQFIGLISAQESLLPLHDRVIQAIANIVDSPGGSFWVRREGDEVLTNTAAWNVPLNHDPRTLPGGLVEFFEAEERILDLTAPAVLLPNSIDVPEWLRSLPRAWILLPLIHRHRLLGLLVLTLPRAPRSLTDEDFALLTTVGRQAASYIAEEESGRALVDARQLELFNQRFAFVVHDIKNLVSQLSLILSNAERHGDNPEFQRDVLATVGHSVARMKNLLEQLSIARRADREPASFDLAEAIQEEWGSEVTRDPRFDIQTPSARCFVKCDRETVMQVLRHVVQNALEAVSANGTVKLVLERLGDFAVLLISDNGPGMTAEFVRDELFRPFKTTKSSGYGIGAYQARELIRQAGGRLDVASSPGTGTRVSIQLPFSVMAAARSAEVHQV
jgi:putative PEP-CTERM system histidine kinase